MNTLKHIYRICVLLMVFFNSIPLYANTNTVNFRIEQGHERKWDHVEIRIWRKYLGENLKHIGVEEIIRNNFDDQRIEIKNVPEFFNISLTLTKGAEKLNVMNYWLVQSGDDVLISIKEDGIIFSGQGSEKYQCKNDFIEKTKNLISKEGFFKTPYNTLLFFESLKPIWKKQEIILSNYKEKLSEEVYTILKADLYGAIALTRHKEIDLLTKYNTFKEDSSYRKYVSNLYIKEVLIYDPVLTQRDIYHAVYFCNYLEMKYKNNKRLIDQKELAVMEGYNALKSMYKGDLREVMLVSYLLNFSKYAFSEQVSACYEDAFKGIKNNVLRGYLKETYAAFNKGEKAFNFELPDQYGKMVKLNDLAGKVIFMDFWFTGCGACEKFKMAIQDPLHQYFKGNANLVFVTVSIDKKAETWKESLRSGRYTNVDAINLYTQGKGVEHPLIKHYKINGFPHLLVIDKNGNMFNASSLGRGFEYYKDLIEKALKI